MNLTCPTCHAQHTLDAVIQDQAAREFMSLSVTAGSLWPVLVVYLGLFRSATGKLTWLRTLALAREVLALPADPSALETALVETVEALRGKGGKPMKNHNYLKRVLESTSQTTPYIPGGGSALVSLPAQSPASRKVSKTASAIGRLENWKR